MVVGGSQQETLDPGFVLLGTRQQGVPVILRELPDSVAPIYGAAVCYIQLKQCQKARNQLKRLAKVSWNFQMVYGGSQQETLDSGFVLFGTRQQGVPVILRELVIPGGFGLVSPSFTVRDVTTELSEP
ncbi:unnamed protein product [Schistosoma margrebowiei]|uniref:Uncharacterized protein n=1 Tax=Schistosoma margrebowiei TaxID=48269 RepID=A0A183MNV7_9TREM|nr:unnamed protein product [Schistosoma margrebowiei]